MRLACVLVYLVGVCRGTDLSPPSSTCNATPNPTPFVIPSLQEWQGGSGTWTLAEESRIVVDPAYANTTTDDSFMANPASLRDFATTLQTDFEAVTGRKLPLVLGHKTPHDIYLTLEDQAHVEGYTLRIDTGVTIAGAFPRGAYWGTRSFLQMVILDPALPRGCATDWPNYPERKFFQDIARKPIPLSDLEEYATLASFFKMNTLHHHYSDNPAVRSKALMPDWAGRYAGFRLYSPNPKFSVYASNDTRYSKDDLRRFQDFIKARGLDLVPEIDTPAHSLFATKVHPEWSIPNDTARGDWLDLENFEVWTFVEDLWTEFLPFFDAREVSIGADEYNPDKGELVRQFVNHMHDFLRRHNTSTRMWGSDVRLPGTTAINPAIHTDHWDWSYSDPVDLVRRGHKVCNLNAPDTYLVPRTAAYWDYIPARKVYEEWEPWVFDIFDKGNASRNLSPTEPLLTGGGFANWNDFMGESVTRVELYDRVSSAMGVFAEKLWSGSDMPYEEWAAGFEKLRVAIPGISLRRRPRGVDSVSPLLNSPVVVSDTTPITTGIDGIASPYTVGMWLFPHGNQTPEAVLLESDDGRVLVSNSTHPTITFENDGYQYTTNVILPLDTWSHLALVADGRDTYIFHNATRRAKISWYNARWDSNRNESMLLTCPLETVGSTHGNSFNGVITSLFALDRASTAGELSYLSKPVP